MSAENDTPCPAVLRCPDRRFCPLVCQEAGSREDPDHRPSGYVTKTNPPAEAEEIRRCEGCGEDYNAFEESHVGHVIPPAECPTPDCPGDVRYSAPGRRHIEGCTYPLPPGEDR